MNDDVKIYELYAENAVAANEQPQLRVYKNGDKEWCLHGELHREDGPAIESANGDKFWWLNDVQYKNVAAWAKAVLMMRNEPHDDAAVQKYVRCILTKDDLI